MDKEVNMMETKTLVWLFLSPTHDIVLQNLKHLSRFFISLFIPLHEKFLQFDWLRAVVFQLNLKYLHVKITNLFQVVV